MAKLSSFENEDGLELLAEIIDPVSEIVADKEFQTLIQNHKIKDSVKVLLRNHPKSVVHILAALDKVSVEDYHGNVVTMTKSLFELLDDKEVLELFISQGQIEEGNASGSAMESTEDVEE